MSLGALHYVLQARWRMMMMIIIIIIVIFLII